MRLSRDVPAQLPHMGQFALDLVMLGEHFSRFLVLAETLQALAETVSHLAFVRSQSSGLAKPFFRFRRRVVLKGQSATLGQRPPIARMLAEHGFEKPTGFLRLVHTTKAVGQPR